MQVCLTLIAVRSRPGQENIHMCVNMAFNRNGDSTRLTPHSHGSHSHHPPRGRLAHARGPLLGLRSWIVYGADRPLPRCPEPVPSAVAFPANPAPLALRRRSKARRSP